MTYTNPIPDPDGGPKTVAEAIEISERSRLAAIRLLALTHDNQDHEAFEVWRGLSAWEVTGVLAQITGALTGIVEQLIEAGALTMTFEQAVAELMAPIPEMCIDNELAKRGLTGKPR
ncbi:hypothetical protein [Herbaspirillum sp.]|uniref:hypothetical protein n=1 Tax=Herbaspirillum sp. TaxID=1890675 RepID=UPI0025851421|nr:hypothetical protein [Herbaspirillum sp.]MCP3949454.1 hypothetical protein [Herbaspirillum sp.]